MPPIEILLLVFLPFSFAGWVNYDVPVLRPPAQEAAHGPDPPRSLSLFVEAGKPIEAGLSTLASHYPTWWVRRKLIKVDDEVQHGGLLDRRARAARPDPAGPTPRSWTSASRVGQPGLGHARAGRDRRAAAGVPVPGRDPDPLPPGGDRPWASFVFLLAFAFFAPLVELIRRLAG